MKATEGSKVDDDDDQRVKDEISFGELEKSLSWRYTSLEQNAVYRLR